MNNRRLRAVLTVFGIGICVLASGCDPSPACDPGQHANTGNCYPNAPADAGAKPDAGGANDDDAGAVTADAGAASSACGPGLYTGFGDPCSSNADCPCQASACATAPLNYCSKLECQNDASACPTGWACTDISAFSPDPKVTHICVKQ